MQHQARVQLHETAEVLAARGFVGKPLQVGVEKR